MFISHRPFPLLFFRKQNPDDATIASKAWSEEEKQKFAVAFAVHGMDWTKVASSLEGRTPVRMFFALRSCSRCWYEGMLVADVALL